MKDKSNLPPYGLSFCSFCDVLLMILLNFSISPTAQLTYRIFGDPLFHFFNYVSRKFFIEEKKNNIFDRLAGNITRG